jgi:DNA polymerase-1
MPQGHIFNELQPAKINPQRFFEVLSESGMNHRVINGFKPDARGYASPIIYDRFGTRTGRLTVQSGPGILTMKKEYRDMIIPSWEGGQILSIDFSSLEARILLYEANGDCQSPDLYSQISQDLFGGAKSRKAVKGAVISELYGSSKTALGLALNIKGRELDDFVLKIKDFFKTSQLKKRLKDEYYSCGHITNKHGKKIQIDEPADHIFVNSYAQSTGVDVSLLGFSKIVNQLKSNKIRPLFLLHDELIIDVHPDEIEKVFQIKDVEIPGYQQRFPLKVNKV